jgi:vacuolar-type H+-ATPase subunit I/STV1
MVGAFDTLQTAKRLKEAGFDEPQAEALTGLLRDVREADQAQLANKADLGALDAKLERVGADLDAKIERVAAELDAKIERVAAELDAKIEKIAAELRAEFAVLRSEMEVLRRDLTIRLGSMIVVATGVLLAAKSFG